MAVTLSATPEKFNDENKTLLVSLTPAFWILEMGSSVTLVTLVWKKWGPASRWWKRKEAGHYSGLYLENNT
jgi:hypothetical protein